MSRQQRNRMGRALRAAPSFSLDFTKGVLDPRLTFTRASGGTYIDSTGVMQAAASGVPRFDYDPVTLAIRGLLIEEARTNLTINSRSWTVGNADTTLAQTQVGADGATNSAWLFSEVVGNANVKFATPASSTVVAGTAYSLTALVKPGTANRVQLTTSSATFGSLIYANFSLVGAGSVLASSGATSTAIKPAGNGFYAITITATPATGGTVPNIVLGFIKSDTATRLPPYVGTGLTLIIDHAQVEAGTFPTSIIPTSGAAATRAADVATVANLAPWLNPAAGTLCVEAIPPADAQTSGFVRVLQLDDGTENNVVSLQRSTSAQRLFVKVGNADQFTDGTSPTWANSTLGRAGVSYTQMALATAFNGGAPRTDSVAAVPVVNTLRLGSQVSAAPKWNGHIRAVDYYPVALDPQTLRRITSATEHPSPRRINPDFSLHFLDGVLDSRITFTRASGGTRINSAGVLVTETTNVPRFDYDPITLACKGLLIEEARTNLVLNSATLSTQNVTVTAAAHTLSFYGTGTVTLSGASTAGPLVGTGSSNSSRVTLTFTPTAGTLTLTVSGTVSNAQLELGTFPTSIIPTTGAAATRAADVATVTSIGSWFNANEGTVATEFVPQASSVDAYAVMLSAGAASSNRIQLTARRGSGSTSGFAVVSGGAATVDMVLASNVSGAATRLAASYKTDDFKATINGATLVTDTAGALPASAPDRLTVGSHWSGDGVSALNGHIRHIDYYRQALPADFITELSR